MQNLIVCQHPGSEVSVFGGLILNKPNEEFDIISVYAHPHYSDYKEGEKVFFNSCRELGVRNSKILPFPFFNERKISVNTIASHLGSINDYDRIYTYNIQQESKICNAIAASVGMISDEVWITSGGGIVDEVINCSEKDFCKRIKLINKYYNELLVSEYILPQKIRNVDLFQKVNGVNLYRFFMGCLEWKINNFDYNLPWDLEISQYEKERYNEEIKLLHKIQWKRLVEVGACEGFFTEQICNIFPDKEIISFEPDNYFLSRLKDRIKGRAKIINGDCSSASCYSTDILFISNVLYYYKEIPYEIFDSNAKFIIVSHDLKFHKDVLDKVFIAKGFQCIAETNINPCIDKKENFLSYRHGANIKIWSKTQFV